MEQHLDMLRQLKGSYADETDLKSAHRIATLHEAIAQLCHDDEQEVMSVIRGVTSLPRRSAMSTSLLPMPEPCCSTRTCAARSTLHATTKADT